LPALVAAIELLPELYFSILVALLGVIALGEVGTMTGAARASIWLIVAIAGALPMFTALFRQARIANPSAPVAIGIVMMILVAIVAARGAEKAPKGITLALIGSAYVGVMFPYFAFVRNSLDGCDRFILMLLLVVVSDSAAYFTGRRLGRIKLAPAVSPKKTVEGAVGGLVASVIAAIVLAWMLEPSWPSITVAGFGATISILAQAGDLAGSALKRSAGVKDSGWIFPGHGGMIDRACSLVFAAAFTYYFRIA
jgi:phosphatidate cytidylyltransferase